MILKKALTIFMTLAIIATMATTVGADLDDTAIGDDIINDGDIGDETNDIGDEDAALNEEETLPDEPSDDVEPPVEDEPFDDYDIGSYALSDDDDDDYDIGLATFDEATYSVARTWITGANEKAVWVCRDCKTNMNGAEPTNCLVCGSIHVTKSFGAILRALLGNIREDRDAFNEPTMDPTLAFFLIATGAIIVGFILSLLYKAVTRKGQPSSRNFAITLVILPIVVATVVFTIGQNVGAGFGVAGIFSMTRFRSGATNSKDLAFIFVSVAIGMACGMGFLFYAFAIALVLCAVLLILNFAGYGDLKAEPKLLRINVPESISYTEVFDSVMEKYAYSWDVARVKTMDLGATFEITYSLMLKNDIDEKAFIDELRTRNGNLNIILRLDTRREGGM
ncbi:MAG: DUF4956 domain-containing protein [Oscillospiraceae bacterium]|nr:DUF4956 domain-containing protein [Oscillospiraceae bacterium]